VKHRPDREPGGFHLAKAALDDPHALVAKGDVGDRERVVIGGQDELAIEMLRSAAIVLGWPGWKSARCSSSPAVPGRTATAKASTGSSGTNC
jgi:hypothetical protein